MPKNKPNKKSQPTKQIDRSRRNKLEAFAKGAAVIAGMSVMPSMLNSAISFRKQTSSTSTLFMADNGNVGIGTTNPGAYKLNVVGDISATSYTGSGSGLTGTFLQKNAGASADFNTLVSPAVYRVNTSLTNNPTAAGDWGQLFVAYGGSDTIGQIYFSYNSALYYIRSGNPPNVGGAGAWQTWKKIIVDDGSGNVNLGTGNLTAARVYGAVWNDIADFFEIEHKITPEYGKVYVRDNKNITRLSKKRCEPGVIGIASDTFGFALGKKEKKNELPIAIGGIVLAHVDKQYSSGTPMVCTREGILTKARFYDRSYKIIATYYKPESQKKWNGVIVNGRNWVKVR